MRHRSHALFVLVAYAALACVGCARQESPAPRPAPRALTVHPQRNQSQAQQNKDKAECQNTASAQATSSESWAHIFTACMSGRGYGVY
jgi:hypothetical protein